MECLKVILLIQATIEHCCCFAFILKLRGVCGCYMSEELQYAEDGCNSKKHPQGGSQSAFILLLTRTPSWPVLLGQEWN